MILRSVLALLGIAFTVYGLDSAAGGLVSLGVQGTAPELLPESAAAMLRDSAMRFHGGVFVCVGLAYVWGAARGKEAYGLLMLLSAFVAVGGIFRLTGALPPAAYPSAIAEILLMPALAYWLRRESRT